MARNTFQQWSTTANSNTDVGGINIAEGCPPSNINNAIREIMAQLATGVDPGIIYATKSANYTAVAADNNTYFRFTASATLALTAAATLTSGWTCFVYAYSGDVTVDPNASETINGNTTLVIRAGEAMQIICDGTNFYGKLIPSFLFFYTTKSANYTALYTDLNYTIRFTASATLSLTAAATLGNAWRIRVMAYNGDVIIDPNASETINGSTILILRSGLTADIVCDGTNFFADVHGDPQSGPQLQGYNTGLSVSTSATNAANAVDISVGAAASDVSPYYLMQLSSALGKRVDTTWTVGGTPAVPLGGLDTGSVGNNTYYIWLIQRSDTGVVDALYSLSSTAPTMPTNYDRKRLIGSFARFSATNTAPSSSFATAGIRYATPSVSPNTTSVDFTVIPPGVKRITALMAPLTMSAAANPLIQLGSGAIQTTGYNGLASVAGSTSISTSTATVTDGLRLAAATTITGSIYGSITFERVGTGSNLWTYKTNVSTTSLNQLIFSGYVLMTGDVDRLRFTTVAGTALLNGTLNVSWDL